MAFTMYTSKYLSNFAIVHSWNLLQAMYQKFCYKLGINIDDFIQKVVCCMKVY